MTNENFETDYRGVIGHIRGGFSHLGEKEISYIALNQDNSTPVVSYYFNSLQCQPALSDGGRGINL